MTSTVASVVLALSATLACGNEENSSKTSSSTPEGGTGGGSTEAERGGRQSSTGGTSSDDKMESQGGSAGSDRASTGDCDLTPCEGATFAGVALPACCQDAETCGIGVGANCFDLGVLDTVPADAGAEFFGEDEEVVLDDSCPDETVEFDGDSVTLQGCCDVSGVCGYSTANLPSTDDLTLPTACVTREDGADFLLGDSGASRSCDYPMSPGDAGADAN